jgi:hypothetical protein
VVVVRPVPLPVRCINCGGSDSLVTWSRIIAIVALVVALGALYNPAREHREFVKQLRARARFELKIDTDRFFGDVYETEAFASVSLVVRVGVSNVGDKAAGETIVNVLTPASPGELSWSTASGQKIGAEPGRPSGDAVTMPGGEEVQAQVVSYVMERVSRRGRREVWFMVENLPVPSDLPVAVVVNSDDLPDDQDVAFAQRTFHVRSKGTPTA